MKITVQVVLHADDDTQTVVREAFTLNRETLAPDTLGLQLQEAKDLLAAVQDTVVANQVTTALSPPRSRARTAHTPRCRPASPTLSNPGAADAPRLTARGSVSVGVTR